MKNRVSHVKFPFRCVDMADINALEKKTTTYFSNCIDLVPNFTYFFQVRNFSKRVVTLVLL